MFTFDEKKKTLVVKILATCQNFGRISYTVTKIWQQTKCSYFLATLPKFDKVESGIKVNRPLVMKKLNNLEIDLTSSITKQI